MLNKYLAIWRKQNNKSGVKFIIIIIYHIYHNNGTTMQFWWNHRQSFYSVVCGGVYFQDMNLSKTITKRCSNASKLRCIEKKNNRTTKNAVTTLNRRSLGWLGWLLTIFVISGRNPPAGRVCSLHGPSNVLLARFSQIKLCLCSLAACFLEVSLRAQ